MASWPASTCSPASRPKHALPERVRRGMHTLKHALLLNKTNWTEAEAERVAAVLEQAARCHR